jgi:hypothetical protein
VRDTNKNPRIKLEDVRNEQMAEIRMNKYPREKLLNENTLDLSSLARNANKTLSPLEKSLRVNESISSSYHRQVFLYQLNLN